MAETQQKGMDTKAVLQRLKALGSEKNRAGMARFGIDTSKAFGVPMSELRPLASQTGKSPELAIDLWATGFHEARLLAILITPPKSMSPERVTSWLEDVQSWDLCDQLTNVVARRTDSDDLVPGLVADEREFIRRAGLALIAWRAVHAKNSPDSEFLSYLDLIRAIATDERNFVWKAAHWALRQIGKRSAALHGPALALAEELSRSDNRTERRVGREAARELSSEKVLSRLSSARKP